MEFQLLEIGYRNHSSNSLSFGIISSAKVLNFKYAVGLLKGIEEISLPLVMIIDSPKVLTEIILFSISIKLEI